jgi:hypothetical protein
MNTHRKNKSAHPGTPDMTLSQLTLAGLSHAQNTRHPPPNRKPTKDQQIAALEDKLRAAQELISNITHFALYYLYLITIMMHILQSSSNSHVARDDHTQVSLDSDGDTEHTTNTEEPETTTTVGAKQKASKSAALAPKYC